MRQTTEPRSLGPRNPRLQEDPAIRWPASSPSHPRWPCSIPCRHLRVWDYKNMTAWITHSTQPAESAVSCSPSRASYWCRRRRHCLMRPSNFRLLQLRFRSGVTGSRGPRDFLPLSRIISYRRADEICGFTLELSPCRLHNQEYSFRNLSVSVSARICAEYLFHSVQDDPRSMGAFFSWKARLSRQKEKYCEFPTFFLLI